jgi:spermidine/putrescine transport system ATP-binding protein
MNGRGAGVGAEPTAAGAQVNTTLDASSSLRGTVELSGVTKRFGAAVAVNELNLTVHAGEFLSLLGPSGCGKTTTLRMLAGFESPDHGEIRINGASVRHTPPHQRDVNTVFQQYALFPHMSVADNVAYGLRQRRVPKSEIITRVADALTMVKMHSMADRMPRQLSGGQQQRVALARALINRPSVLLLDEPLGALDRALREEMQIELKLLQSRLGITFIFVTHDQEEAMGMSDRIAVMHGGRIEQLADPATVYEQPSTAFVAGFIGRNNFWSAMATADGARERDGIIFVSSRSERPVVSGQAVRVAVRPEHIQLVADNPGHHSNVVSGTIAHVAQYGGTIQYVLRTVSNDVVIQLPVGRRLGFAVGHTAYARWNADHVFLYAGDPIHTPLPSATHP